MKRRYGDALTIDCYSRPGDVPKVLSETEAIARHTWQRGVGVGFKNDRATRRSMEFAAERGWLLAYILSIDGIPRAFHQGLKYGESLHLTITGFDSRFRSDGLGMVLMCHMIESMCNDPSIRCIDFGPGDQEHKRSLCTHTRRNCSVIISAPTLRGVIINLKWTSVLAAAKIARRLFDRNGFVERRKSQWRRRHVPRAADLDPDENSVQRPEKSVRGVR